MRPRGLWMKWLPAAGIVAVGVGLVAMRSTGRSAGPVGDVAYGPLAVRITALGTLRPASAVTYRSPLQGRDTEVLFLAPEGIRVQAGDLIARVDASAVDAELRRALQAARQAALDVELADAQLVDARLARSSLDDGAGALEQDEARVELQLAERKTARLAAEFDGLKPLLARGYITREELDTIGGQLEDAQAHLEIARRRTRLLLERTHPQARARADLAVAQRESALEGARAHAAEAAAQVEALRAAVRACAIYARAPGLVLYEDLQSSSPRRKLRVGDRVSGTQGLVTIPDVDGMLVDTSVREQELSLVRSGLRATIRVDAYPGLRLAGTVAAIGTLAQRSTDRPYEGKRYGVSIALDASPSELRPDMTALAEIHVADRARVLLAPIAAVFDRRAGTVVFVSHGSSFEERPVTVGDSDGTRIELRSGVRAGEQVLLTDPAASGQ